MTEHIHEHEPVASDEAPVTCTVHPDRETALRCNKCGRPMCVECAVQTPVGYRCRECIREQQDKFYTATTMDNVIAAGVAFGLSLVMNWIAMLIISIIPLFGLFIALLFFAPAAGSLIPQAILTLTRRRRSRYMGEIAVVAIVIGAIASQWRLIQFLFMGAPLGSLLMALLWPAIFTVIMASTAYGWLRFGGKRY
ncbi:B-box zinc finger protein [Chloroflexota bacterium]